MSLNNVLDILNYQSRKVGIRKELTRKVLAYHVGLTHIHANKAFPFSLDWNVWKKEIQLIINSAQN